LSELKQTTWFFLWGVSWNGVEEESDLTF